VLLLLRCLKSQSPSRTRQTTRRQDGKTARRLSLSLSLPRLLLLLPLRSRRNSMPMPMLKMLRLEIGGGGEGWQADGKRQQTANGDGGRQQALRVAPWW